MYVSDSHMCHGHFPSIYLWFLSQLPRRSGYDAYTTYIDDIYIGLTHKIGEFSFRAILQSATPPFFFLFCCHAAALSQRFEDGLRAITLTRGFTRFRRKLSGTTRHRLLGTQRPQMLCVAAWVWFCLTTEFVGRHPFCSCPVATRRLSRSISRMTGGRFLIYTIVLRTQPGTLGRGAQAALRPPRVTPKSPFFSVLFGLTPITLGLGLTLNGLTLKGATR